MDGLAYLYVCPLARVKPFVALSILASSLASWRGFAFRHFAVCYLIVFQQADVHWKTWLGARNQSMQFAVWSNLSLWAKPKTWLGGSNEPRIALSLMTDYGTNSSALPSHTSFPLMLGIQFRVLCFWVLGKENQSECTRNAYQFPRCCVQIRAWKNHAETILQTAAHIFNSQVARTMQRKVLASLLSLQPCWLVPLGADLGWCQ